MKLSNLYFAGVIGGYEFQFSRNQETKVWTFTDYNATIGATNIDDAIKVMETVIKIVKLLNKTTDENVVQTIADVSQGDAA
jgi:hypothetical protein